MSNQFSYELDERQIRIMLCDGETENDPSAWNRFEQLAQHDTKPHQNSFSPKFNISISRSVLVPVIFVLLIGGLSATLFSFVDFKKKDISATKNTPEEKLTAIPAKTKSQPADQVPSKSEEPVNNAEKVAAAPTPTVQQTVTEKPVISQPVVKPETKPEPKPDTKIVSKPAETAPLKTNSTSVAAADIKANQPPVMKKRKKKVVSEEIPTINTSSTNLNQESQEPELELR